jgi:large-conductance mechanosensitive channel
MDYLNEEETTVRQGMKPIFIWIPAIVSGLMFIIIMILKLAEKTNNGFTTWGWVIAIIIITLIVTFGISIAVYLFTSLKDKKPEERKYNSREKCDILLRKEIRRRTNYNLSDFSETGESIEGVGWYGIGQGEKDQDLIYYHLYRIQKGTRKRYLLGVMDTEVGKEDHVIITQSPMNFQDLRKLIRETCNGLCRNPERMMKQERIYRDEISGRSEVETTESPFDMPENQDYEEQR